MSYNGIGLQTARGSGTSGYVQRSALSENKKDQNTGHRQKRQIEKEKEERRLNDEKAAEEKRKARGVIRDHGRKRRIDVACMQLRDNMEDASEDEEVIEKAVSELRTKLNHQEELADAHKRKQEKSSEDLGKEKSDIKRHRPDIIDDAESPGELSSEITAEGGSKSSEDENGKISTDTKPVRSGATQPAYGYVRRYDERR